MQSGIRWTTLVMMIASLVFAACEKKKGGGGGGDSPAADDCTTVDAGTTDTEADSGADSGIAGDPATEEAGAEETALALQDEAAADAGDTPAADDAGEVDAEAETADDVATTTSDPCQTAATTDDSGDTEVDTGPVIIPPQEFKEGHGCVQGAVINGYSGKPMDITPHGQNLYVLIRGQKLTAATLDDPNLVGQYYICGIPLDETYSIFGFIPAYHAFESTVNITSTAPIASTTQGAYTKDLAKKDPIKIANIVLFPVASGDRDLLIRVYNEGVPVEGALVDIEPVNAGADHFTATVTGAAFNYSNGTRNFNVRGTTDANGVATFEKTTVSLGHPYALNVTPAVGSNLNASTGTFTLGISGPALSTDKNNFEYNVELGSAQTGLKIISCSMQHETWNATGKVTAVFNQQVNLAGPDGWTVTLGGGPLTAALAANVTNNNASEHVTGKVVNGNTITLEAKFGTAPVAPDYTKDKAQAVNDDVDTTVQYVGVKVDVVGDATQNTVDITTVDPDNLCGTAPKFVTRMFKEHPGP